MLPLLVFFEGSKINVTKVAIFDENMAVGKSKYYLVSLYLYELTKPSDPLWWLFYCAVRQACFHSRDQPKWKGLVKVTFFFTFFPKLSDSQYLKPNWDLKNTAIHTVSCQNFCVFLFTYFLSELRRAIFNTIYFFFREIAMLSSKNFHFI